jgi:imidazolonepropionase-like amidohydrolase
MNTSHQNNRRSRRRASLSSTLFAVLINALIGNPIAAADTPATTEQHTVAIINATVHPVSDELIEGGTVLFANGKIVAVGSDVPIPEDARVIDASGQHVYPGFIHGQSILGLSEISRTTESTDVQELGEINPMIRAQVAYHPASEHLSVAAVHGVTTVVPTPSGSLIAGMPAAMMTDGWTWEEMTIREKLGMVIQWPATTSRERIQQQLQQLDDALEKTRRYQQARAVSDEDTAAQHPLDLRWEALLPVVRQEMPVLLSVGDLRQIQAAVAWGQRQQLRVVLVGNRHLDRVAETLAERQIPVMLTGVIGGPAHAWEGYDAAYTVAAHLHRAGVPFCIAGDTGAANAYRLAHHAAAAVAFGLPVEQGLKAITLDAARILGIDDVLGSLQPGKDATLVISDGHPLEIRTKNQQVFLRGRSIDMTDKHRRLYERYLEKHRQHTAATTPSADDR